MSLSTAPTPSQVKIALVTNAPTSMIVGRVSAGTGNIEYLTYTQVTSLLDAFTTSANGLVPAPGGVTGKVLSDGGTWISPSAGSVTSVGVSSANGFSGGVSNPSTTPILTLSTTISGMLKGNGTAILAATPGTDFAPATSGSAILKGNGAGGFSAATAGVDYGSAPLSTATILDFGSGKDHLSATVALAGVTTTSVVVGSVGWDPSFTTRSEEELAIDPINVSFRAGVNQVTVNASANLRTVVGKYKISIVAY